MATLLYSIMTQIPNHIKLLIEKVLAGTATVTEQCQVNDWYRQFSDDEVTIESIRLQTEQQVNNRIKQRLSLTIDTSTFTEKSQKNRKIFRLAAAAAVIAILGFGTYFIAFKNTAQQKVIVLKAAPAAQQPQDLVPGGNKAVLTLANGATIILDSAANGLLTQQGNMQVKKLSNGLLAYVINGKEITENDEAFYNTISTPRGGQYQVTLSDGSKVWLNAASSIRFPVMFTGNERKVQVTGEVYMEIAKNAAKPFKVITNNCTVEVLGTHFNINAYDDEAAVKTTLLEGRVKVYSKQDKAEARTISPGQQVTINSAGRLAVKNNADIEEAVAWKNGLFYFSGADIKTILRQISRWYDADVEFRGTGGLQFTGQLTRNENVSKVFEKLALTGEVSFTIEGKKIIVTQ